MAQPRTWSSAELAEDAGAATDRFRRTRLNEPLERYTRFFPGQVGRGLQAWGGRYIVCMPVHRGGESAGCRIVFYGAGSSPAFECTALYRFRTIPRLSVPFTHGATMLPAKSPGDSR